MSPERIAVLLEPFLPPGPQPPGLFEQLGRYLDLLLRWNARTNLTAIRDPEQIVLRHFGESLFAANLLPPDAHTLLDLGSGAGLPGIPLQLLRPSLSVTLAESQNKKAAFLREVTRSLGLPTAIHAGRAEALPPASFDCVALRAVDRMATALTVARRLSRGPVLALLSAPDLESLAPPGTPSLAIPLSTSTLVCRMHFDR